MSDSGRDDETYDPDLIVKPLESLDELWKWENSSSYLKTASIPIKRRSNSRPAQPRTLVCHDMKGGYLDDRFVQGVTVPNCYRFFHWSHVDIFVYFSHSFITIPPPSWIDAGHLHGVPVLGTLITEDVSGTEICNKVFSGEDRLLIVRFIEKLVAIAAHYKFEGWLINIENAIEKSHIQHLQNFLYWLTVKMREVIPGSYVIWYDSVTIDGELKWQNELNLINMPFFHACDGIYLNYNWDDVKLASSVKLAGKRVTDVYVGVDVFGRGTPGGGGFSSDVWYSSDVKSRRRPLPTIPSTLIGDEEGYHVTGIHLEAFKSIRNYGLSVALFAPGWVHEVLGERDFTDNEYKYWSLLAEFSPVHGPASHPFSTSFCQGFGNQRFRYGKVLQVTPWNNQSLQQYQPSYHSFYNKELAPHKMRVTWNIGYTGGGCLEIAGSTEKPPIPLFRLFNSDLEFKVTLLCTYTFKCLAPRDVDINLSLRVVDKRKGTTSDWILANYEKLPPLANFRRTDRNGPSSPRSVNVIKPANKEISFDLIQQGIGLPSEPENGWIKRCYVINPPPEGSDSSIRKVSLYVDLPRDVRERNYTILLGQVQILPLHMLLDRHELQVDCSHVAVDRISPSSQMKVSAIITWMEGNPHLVDSYDVYCRLMWPDHTGQSQSITKYVDCTRRNAYKMNAVDMHYPGTRRFQLHFVVQEHLYAITPTDVEHCPYASIQFS